MQKRRQKVVTKIPTYSPWDDVFDGCVHILRESANKLDPYWPGGMNYEKINVIAFCIVAPAVLVGSLGLNAYLLHKLSRTRG